jgi:hypothetical protein
VNRIGIKPAWTRGQQGWPASYPLVQFPNVPLIVSLVASVLHGAFSGTAADYAWAISRLALAVWAYEELVRGDNAFRRVLGLVVLVLITRGLVGRAS